RIVLGQVLRTEDQDAVAQRHAVQAALLDKAPVGGHQCADTLELRPAPVRRRERQRLDLLWIERLGDLHGLPEQPFPYFSIRDLAAPLGQQPP
ncbi:hypothetical protein RZS08_13045, partial [Arthrospira platensis SPKY1]|nr:hypothetical protein [Arthrospira platensis SPKY1]